MKLHKYMNKQVLAAIGLAFVVGSASAASTVSVSSVQGHEVPVLGMVNVSNELSHHPSGLKNVEYSHLYQDNSGVANQTATNQEYRDLATGKANHQQPVLQEYKNFYHAR